MREALKRLQQAGLVSISQGGATRVRDWRRHGGLELLLDGEVPAELRGAAGGDGDARVHRRRRRAAVRAAADAALKAQIVARAEQFAAVEDLEARNAHYEVLWDLIVEGADNIAYRLALTTLVERQRIASVEARGGGGRARATSRRSARSSPRSPPATDDARVLAARELLERSIPSG